MTDTPETITVYASIGNSDDKLTQAQWSAYARRFQVEINQYAQQIHGVWHSAPADPYQNMCVCFEIRPHDVRAVRYLLAMTTRDFRQDSIAWAVAPVTEFVTVAEANWEATRG